MAFLKRSRPLTLFIATLLAIFGIAAVVYGTTTERFAIYIDGELVTVRGHFDTVGDVLTAADVVVQPADWLFPGFGASAESTSPIQIQRAKTILVRTEDGDAQSYTTHQATLGSFLAETGIEIRRTDQVSADGTDLLFSQLNNTPVPLTLEIGRFHTVTIHENSSQRVLRTSAQTVGDLLLEAGITLYAADGVEPTMGSWIDADIDIFVQRSQPLTIKVDGRVIQTRSHYTNAADVLTQLGIGLIGEDYALPAHPLQANDIIEVVRVTYDFRVEDTPIPFSSQWQAAPDVELDTNALLQAGEPGIQRRRVRVRYDNGVESGQTVDGEWVAKNAVPEIIGFGTNIVVRTLQTADGPIEYWRKVKMRVTSYTAASSGKAPDHPAYGITASGVLAGTGIVAIDKRVVPFKTYLYVNGYGVGFAGDTGGGVLGRWIDLGYDEDEYIGWSGYTDVYYLTPVPPTEDINYQIPTQLP